MKIFGKNASNSQSGRGYATSLDFCRVFRDDMNRLYLLSLLLTADPELAERCFVRGLEDSKGSSSVFKEWARSWARRRIITNAVAAVKPLAGVKSGRGEVASQDSAPGEIKGLPPELAAIASLAAFDRFVFVMSVLEGYPERDVRLLLNCSSADVVQARTRALDQISALGQRDVKTENGIKPAVEGRESKRAPWMLPHLAASA